MTNQYPNLKIIAGSSNPELASGIAEYIGVDIAKCRVGKFSDGELRLINEDNFYDNDVFIIQSTSAPQAEFMFEMMMYCASAKGCGARRVIGVIPYFGYSRQDRKINPGDCITAKLAANTLESAGFDAFVLADLHALAIQGFFHTHMTYHLDCRRVISEYLVDKIVKHGEGNVALVSPDAGQSKRGGERLSKALGISHVVMDKERPDANQCEIVSILGDIEGKWAFLVDDMIDTAGTICEAVKALHENGARGIYIAATHGVLSGPAIERLDKAPVTELALMETIRIPPEKRLKKMVFLPTAPIIGDTILKMHLGYDLSKPLPTII